MRRLFSPANADRLIPLVFGGYFLYASVWLWVSVFDDADDTIPLFFDWLWPFVFAAAGILGVAHSCRPASKHLAAWSGGVMILALLSRAAAGLASWASTNETFSMPRAFLGAGTWTILGYAVGLIWRRVLLPMGNRRRATP